MPKVVVKTAAPGDPKEAYQLASDMESYPNFMDDVSSVKVKERGNNWTVTEWTTHPRGLTLTWTERDEFDEEALKITYAQVNGDLEKFEGYWAFRPAKDGVEIELVVDFEIGIPMFKGLLQPFAKLIVKENCQKMLCAIKQTLEGKN